MDFRLKLTVRLTAVQLKDLLRCGVEKEVFVQVVATGGMQSFVAFIDGKETLVWNELDELWVEAYDQ